MGSERTTQMRTTVIVGLAIAAFVMVAKARFVDVLTKTTGTWIGSQPEGTAPRE